MEIKRKTLAKAAKALNDAGITWALGGSGMLYFQGALDGFRDVDLMVAPEDVAAAKQIFAGLDGLEYAGLEEKYDLLQYQVDGLEFDVMQGFRFGTYSYTLQTQDVTGSAEIDGIPIPLHSMQIWQEFYRLMGRTERTELIDTYIKQNPV